MEKTVVNRIKTAYDKSVKRLLFLDLEGTLIPAGVTAHNSPEDFRGLLFRLTNEPGNDVVLISSETQEILDDAFSYLPLTLVSENGGSFRRAKGEWQPVAAVETTWKEPLEQSLRSLVMQYPSSTLEVRHFSVVWHFAQVHSLPHLERRQLQVAWRSLARQHQVTLQERFSSIEFVAPGISKGKFAAHWMANHDHYDFILAIGDDPSDEDLFEAIGDNYFTVKVGLQLATAATARLEKQSDVLPFLAELIRSEKQPIMM